MIKHLKVCYGRGVDKHAQTIMKDLKISYQYCTPQPMGDQFWFWNCKNIPDILPYYMKPLEVNPLDYVGFGLSKKRAEDIIKGGE